jgi:hypothetical protein
MRALIVAKSNQAPPPEAIPTLVQGFIDWRERYRGQMESFDFFASSNGGCGIVNADETAIYEMLASWPFGPFSNIELYPLVEGDKALRMFQDIVRQTMG